jgi:phage protein U
MFIIKKQGLHGNTVPAELVGKNMLNIIDTFKCRCNKDGEVIGKHMLNNINTFKCRFNKDGENQRNVFEINFFFI